MLTFHELIWLKCHQLEAQVLAVLFIQLPVLVRTDTSCQSKNNLTISPDLTRLFLRWYTYIAPKRAQIQTFMIHSQWRKLSLSSRITGHFHIMMRHWKRSSLAANIKLSTFNVTWSKWNLLFPKIYTYTIFFTCSSQYPFSCHSAFKIELIMFGPVNQVLKILPLKCLLLVQSSLFLPLLLYSRTSSPYAWIAIIAIVYDSKFSKFNPLNLPIIYHMKTKDLCLGFHSLS